jgi:hypothetical protein
MRSICRSSADLHGAHGTEFTVTIPKCPSAICRLLPRADRSQICQRATERTAESRSGDQGEQHVLVVAHRHREVTHWAFDVLARRRDLQKMILGARLGDYGPGCGRRPSWCPQDVMNAVEGGSFDSSAERRCCD